MTPEEELLRAQRLAQAAKAPKLTPEQKAAQALVNNTGARAGISSATGKPESLGSLEANAKKQQNIYDGLVNLSGNVLGLFGIEKNALGIPVKSENIDWGTRKFTTDGQVVVTPADMLMGRSQPELQLAYENARRDALILGLQDDYEKQFPNQSLREQFTDDKGQELNASNLTTKINNQALRVEKRAPLIEKLISMEGGPEAYRFLTSLSNEVTKGNPSPQQVAAEITRLTPTQSSTLQANATANAKLDLLEAQTERIGDQTRIQEQELGILRDNSATSRWQAEATAAHNANTLAAQKYNNAESRRLQELQLQQNQQLAIMNMQNNMEDRRLNREDKREDRELVKQRMRIELLMNSLRGLGRAFSL